MIATKKTLAMGLIGFGCLASAALGYIIAPGLAQAGIVPGGGPSTSPCRVSTRATASTVFVSFEIDSAATLTVTLTDAAGAEQQKKIPVGGASQGQLTFEQVAPGESIWQSECQAGAKSFDDNGSIQVPAG